MAQKSCRCTACYMLAMFMLGLVTRSMIRTMLIVASDSELVYNHDYESDINMMQNFLHVTPALRPLRPHRNDSIYHKDNTSVAENLEKTVRLLCVVITSPENLAKRAIHVKSTWGKRCNILYFASDNYNETFGTMPIRTKKGYKELPAKVTAAFDYLYARHLDDADWFFKSDDDTYAVVENMRYFLSSKSPDEPVYYGQRFRGKTDFFSGGAGYVLSREALRRFGSRTITPKCSPNKFKAEDVMMSACLSHLGVHMGESVDALNRSRFHCLTPQDLMKANFKSWYHSRDAQGAKQGYEWMSDYPITFHYIAPKAMYMLEYFIYHVQPHGIIKGMQDLNTHDTEEQHLMT